jgi:hypothetical protein
MAGNFLWWVCIILEATLLVRGFSSGLAKKYRLFYAYIIIILTSEVIRLLFYLFAQDRYRSVYWYTELATVVASYAVIIEIWHQGLRHYPVLSKRITLLLWIIFAITVSYASCSLVASQFVLLLRVAADLGRDLRFVEGALLLIMLWFFGRHRIPLGRNLGGISIGAAIWIGANVINMAFLSLPGQNFSKFLRGLLPIIYFIALVIWCQSLWMPVPASASRFASEPEENLALVTSKTRGIVNGISYRFLKALKQ